MASKPPAPTAVPSAAEKKGSKKMMIFGGAAVLLLGLGGGVAWMMLGGKSKSADAAGEADGGHGEAGEAGGKASGKAAPIYFALDPAFTVNLADEGSTRYLQVEVQVMARQQSSIDAVELHMPVIRSQLLLLFSQHKVDELRSREAREKLQAKALEEVRRILTEESGKAGVEALYFTSFVTQ